MRRMGPAVRCGLLAVLAFASAGGVASAVPWMPANAELLAEETFTYPGAYGTGLDGKEGGSGWGGPWVASGSTATVQSEADPRGGVLQVGNRVGYYEETRPLASTAGDDILASFWLDWTAGTANGGDSVAVAFGPPIGQNEPPPYWPSFGLTRDTGPNGEDFYVRLAEDQAGYSGELVQGRWHLLVARLYKEESETYNRFALWVDPANMSSLGDPDALAMGDSGISTFSDVSVRWWSFGSGDRARVDDLRLEQAGVVPEPLSTAFMAGAFLAVAWRARRRKKE